MSKDLELWSFVADNLRRKIPLIILVVADSSGSSPGRVGYKMAVTAGGELCGSIGGGVMEVNLVERSRRMLDSTGRASARISPQVHRRDSPNASGMICSGRQTVLFKSVDENDIAVVELIIEILRLGRPARLLITNNGLSVAPPLQLPDKTFESDGQAEFTYTEKLGPKNALYIVGGGHCSLALSELMSRMDFRIAVFDDRPELNTLAKNRFADEITVISDYHEIGSKIPEGQNVYVVVMTLGFTSDEIVIRAMIGKKVRYLGVLGSRAKMATLFKQLKKDGFSAERLDQIHTPIGLQINSHTPEEIAVSIAAEIISFKNG